MPEPESFGMQGNPGNPSNKKPENEKRQRKPKQLSPVKAKPRTRRVGLYGKIATGLGITAGIVVSAKPHLVWLWDGLLFLGLILSAFELRLWLINNGARHARLFSEANLWWGLVVVFAVALCGCIAFPTSTRQLPNTNPILVEKPQPHFRVSLSLPEFQGFNVDLTDKRLFFSIPPTQTLMKTTGMLVMPIKEQNASITLRLKVANDGSSAAEGLHVYLAIPSVFEVTTGNGWMNAVTPMIENSHSIVWRENSSIFAQEDIHLTDIVLRPKTNWPSLNWTHGPTAPAIAIFCESKNLARTHLMFGVACLTNGVRPELLFSTNGVVIYDMFAP